MSSGRRTNSRDSRTMEEEASGRSASGSGDSRRRNPGERRRISSEQRPRMANVGHLRHMMVGLKHDEEARRKAKETASAKASGEDILEVMRRKNAEIERKFELARQDKEAAECAKCPVKLPTMSREDARAAEALPARPKPTDGQATSAQATCARKTTARSTTAQATSVESSTAQATNAQPTTAQSSSVRSNWSSPPSNAECPRRGVGRGAKSIELHHRHQTRRPGLRPIQSIARLAPPHQPSQQPAQPHQIPDDELWFPPGWSTASSSVESSESESAKSPSREASSSAEAPSSKTNPEPSTHRMDDRDASPLQNDEPLKADPDSCVTSETLPLPPTQSDNSLSDESDSDSCISPETLPLPPSPPASPAKTYRAVAAASTATSPVSVALSTPPATPPTADAAPVASSALPGSVPAAQKAPTKKIAMLQSALGGIMSGIMAQRASVSKDNRSLHSGTVTMTRGTARSP